MDYVWIVVYIMTTDLGAKLLNKNGRVTRGITLPAVAKSAHSHRFILHTIYMYNFNNKGWNEHQSTHASTPICTHNAHMHISGQ